MHTNTGHRRLTVSISPRQDKALRNLARKTGFSVSALARMALASLIDDPAKVFEDASGMDSDTHQIEPRSGSATRAKSAGSRAKRAVA